MYVRYFNMDEKVSCPLKVIQMVDDAVAKANLPDIEIEGWKIPVEMGIKYFLYRQKYPVGVENIVVSVVEPEIFGEDGVNFRTAFCECITPEGKTYTVWMEGRFDVLKDTTHYSNRTYHTCRAYFDYAVKHDDCLN